MSRMQEQITDTPAKTFAGIDVGKTHLDIYVHPGGRALRIGNTKTALGPVVEQLAELGPHLVTLEATGKYHRLAHSMLHDAGVPVAVVNPFRSRQFAESTGKMAKTDRIDAETLALYGERMMPQAVAPTDAITQQLHDLHTARRQVTNEVADLKRQLQTTDYPLAAKQIGARIKLGQEHKRALEKEILRVIADNPDLKRRFDILVSIPGIGATTAAIMLADLSELGSVNARQIAALAGVAPMNWDSGKKHGNRMIRGGRRCIRNVLYMGAVSCIRRSDHLALTYRNMVARGKPPKVALTAVMRKIVILANTLIAENRTWQPHCPDRNSRPCLA